MTRTDEFSEYLIKNIRGIRWLAQFALDFNQRFQRSLMVAGWLTELRLLRRSS